MSLQDRHIDPGRDPHLDRRVRASAEHEDHDLLWLDCRTCGGSGGGEGPFRCAVCSGRGQVRNESLWREMQEDRADHDRDEAKDRRATGDG